MSNNTIFILVALAFGWWWAKWVYDARSTGAGCLLLILMALLTIGVCNGIL